MNWQIEGKKKNGKAGKFPIVGGPDTEDAVRKLAGVTHPDFTVEKVTPLDGSLRATAAAAEAVDDTGKTPRPHAKP